MRKPIDICLLCQVNPATKTNSHILPKFLSKKLFGPKGSIRGFEVSSKNPVSKPAKVVQDSPKEDYILCPGCEQYFSVLESLGSAMFLNWKYKVSTGEYSKKQFSPDLAIALFSSVSKPGIRLLVYSIFWRASASSHTMFQNISIASETLEQLRLSLMEYKAVNNTNVLKELIDPKRMALLPYAILTSERFSDDTSNVLFVPGYNNCYRLIVDQFSFILFYSKEKIPNAFFQGVSNLELEDCRLIVFSEQMWKDTVRQPVLDLLAKEMVKNSNQSPTS